MFINNSRNSKNILTNEKNRTVDKTYKLKQTWGKGN